MEKLPDTKLDKLRSLRDISLFPIHIRNKGVIMTFLAFMAALDSIWRSSIRR
jgi:hypothetical protein